MNWSGYRVDRAGLGIGHARIAAPAHLAQSNVGIPPLLFFALTSSIAAVAAFELAMMQSVTAEHYAAAHVPLSIEGVDGKGALLRFVLPWLGDSLGATDLRLCLRSMMTPRC